MTKSFTHKGWFGLCPVYIGDVDSPGPIVDARHPALDWLFWMSEAIFGFCIMLKTSIDPSYVPTWPLMITGELADPITLDEVRR